MDTIEIKNEEQNITEAPEETTQNNDGKFKQFVIQNKKKIIIFGSIAVAIVAIFTVGIYVLRSENRGNVTNEVSVPATTISEPVNYDAVLTGASLSSSELANRHPLAVMIENHPDARPQAGLAMADIVYEAIVEGGITRFMAVYSSQDADKVGPIRSARKFYIDWALGYKAFYAHVGGHITALSQIKSDGVYDLDQFSHSKPYYRDYSANVATEHTMFSTTKNLYEEASKSGYSSDNNFSIYKFKTDPKDNPEIVLPESQTVEIPYSNSTYLASFRYDKTLNSYKRYQNNLAHTDRIDKSQITVKNLIVMTVERSQITGVDKDTWDMETIGSGKAQIFIDGTQIVGTWKKDSKTNREKFYDGNSNEIEFNRGNFWISVIPPSMSATVQ